MRITHSSMMRSYISNLRSSISNLAKSNEKLSSMRKYSRASENTSEASRAYVIREQLYKNELYLKNIEDSISALSAAETSLLTINDLIKTVQERSLRGETGTIDEIDRDVIAKEIQNIREQILQSINIKFGTRYLFGSSNNIEAPFSIGTDGKLVYNGTKVADIFRDPVTGKLMSPNPNYDPSDPDSTEYLEVPKNKDIYVDIGLGIVVNDDRIDPKTALKISSSGIDAIGYGEDNLFDLLTKIENSFRNNDMSNIDDYLDKLSRHKDNIMLHVTDIGSRVSYMEKSKERIENEIYNLKVKQADIEAIDLEYETINNKSYEMAWMINLQLGSQILPASIFDFLR
ncbi:MAG: hypothetical protein GX193_04735 [Clostridiales bacterium]|nr:hypothetical protein [Clostridiales bacterium]